MATAQPAVKLTYEGYCAAPADKRFELLDGELLPTRTFGREETLRSPLLTRFELHLINEIFGS